MLWYAIELQYNLVDGRSKYSFPFNYTHKMDIVYWLFVFLMAQHIDIKSYILDHYTFTYLPMFCQVKRNGKIP